ncbi:arginase family protein [Agromyces tropicus]|uniref:Arginase family protein n=1 Tax=Agromyces tropicus TaxID=555371 RepID=A0ABP5FLJ1_9MICO
MSSIENTPGARAAASAGTTLRLVWPSWQGAGAASVEHFASEFPLDVARRGYSVGTAVLEAVLGPHDGPTARVEVPMGDEGLELRDGIEAKDAVVAQLGRALDVLADHAPDRVLTLGGDCAVSVAPFTALAERYGDDLAVVWIDSHPDVGTPASEYPGYHAMAVSAITGHGDPDIVALLPATVAPSRVALAGLHSWTEDDFPNAAEWGLSTFSPADLRASTAPLLEWLAVTGCAKVAIHLDVDVVDSNEAVFGLGVEPDGLTTTDVRRIMTDLGSRADVVAVTVAEYVPRQVIRMQRLLDGLPLIP